MRVRLVVSDDCAPCRVAETIWRSACAKRGMTLEVVDLGSAAGAAISKSFEIRTLPAVLIDDDLVAVGVQNPSQVDAMIEPAERTKSAPSD